MSTVNTRPHLFTSESVTEAHPDKVADRISDSILDALIDVDPTCRVACETVVNTGLVCVFGEVSSSAWVDINRIVRSTVTKLGYDDPALGFDGNTCGVMISLDEQSADIAQGVDKSREVRDGSSLEHRFDEQGAGDQGMMFGFACSETSELMPAPITFAHRLTAKLSEVRKSGAVDYLRPDGKAQVTFRYDNGAPTAVDTVLVSSQHDDGVTRAQIHNDLLRTVIKPVLGEKWGDDFKVLVNPTGRFVIGGPVGDAGLTGRKIIVDTYGGYARHGGGAFSGKDPSKVDRSGTYAARWVAKNIVASGASERCEVQISYAIGVARPVSVMVETFGTETVDPNKINEAVDNVFDLRPLAIIEELDLRRPLYSNTSAYGHFGRENHDLFPWEALTKVDDLRSYFS